MAKITIAGNAMVITSSMSLDEIKMLEKYRPNALKLKDGEKKEVVFAVGSTIPGKGSINEIGASFGDATHDEEGLATITTMIPAGIDNVVEYASDKVGAAILYLNKLEESIDEVVEDVAAERAAIRDTITVA